MTIGTYVRCPRATPAVQLRWTQWNEVCELLGDALGEHKPNGAGKIPEGEAADTCGEEGPDFITVNVLTANGHVVPVRHGDWILPDSEPGTFYPCAPEVFARDYGGLDVPLGDQYRVHGLASVLLDLDRCKHGRHAADACLACPGGKSAGNRLLPVGRAIGHDVHGVPTWVREHDIQHNPAEWRRTPTGGPAEGTPELDAVYRERNRIVAALTHRWRSVVGNGLRGLVGGVPADAQRAGLLEFPPPRHGPVRSRAPGGVVEPGRAEHDGELPPPAGGGTDRGHIRVAGQGRAFWMASCRVLTAFSALPLTLSQAAA